MLIIIDLKKKKNNNLLQVKLQLKVIYKRNNFLKHYADICTWSKFILINILVYI